jgi:hypothetical protein
LESEIIKPTVSFCTNQFPIMTILPFSETEKVLLVLKVAITSLSALVVQEGFEQRHAGQH